MPYGQSRNLEAEREVAEELSRALREKGIPLDAKYWSSYVNALAYGGYTLTDALNDITARRRGQEGNIHPGIPRQEFARMRTDLYLGGAEGGESSDGAAPEEDFARLIMEQLFPEQEQIPSFEESGLYDRAAVEKLFSAEFDPYFEKLGVTEEEKKRLAEEAMNRALGRLSEDYTGGLKEAQEDYGTNTEALKRSLEKTLGTLSDTTAMGEQLASGVHQKEIGEEQTETQRQQGLLDRALARYKQKAQTQYQRGQFDIQDPYKQEYESQYGGYQTRLAELKNKKALTKSGYLSDEEARARERYYDRFNTQ